jgi:hypothetical protein
MNVSEVEAWRARGEIGGEDQGFWSLFKGQEAI